MIIIDFNLSRSGSWRRLLAEYCQFIGDADHWVGCSMGLVKPVTGDHGCGIDPYDRTASVGLMVNTTMIRVLND